MKICKHFGNDRNQHSSTLPHLASLGLASPRLAHAVPVYSAQLHSSVSYIASPRFASLAQLHHSVSHVAFPLIAWPGLASQYIAHTTPAYLAQLHNYQFCTRLVHKACASRSVHASCVSWFAGLCARLWVCVHMLMYMNVLCARGLCISICACLLCFLVCVGTQQIWVSQTCWVIWGFEGDVACM